MVKKWKQNFNYFKLNTFSVFISNNTHIFRELLTNKSKHIFRVLIEHYWHFQGVTEIQYYTLPDIKQYWHFQRVNGKHIFPDLTSNNTDVFRELLANNTSHFSRVHDKHYWHFQRVTGKEYYNLFRPHCWFPKKY